MFDNDQNHLQLVFDSLLPVNFSNELLDENTNTLIVDKLRQFKEYELNSNQLDVQNFYLIYLYANLLTENLKQSNHSDPDNYYLSNIINLLITKFDSCRKILFRDIKLIYKQVEDSCKSIIDFYMIFFTSEPNVIQNDILNIFLLKIFRDHNPLNINDLREYYNSLLRYLFYSYLKSKTDGLIESDLSPIISKEERFILQSTRSKLYNNGLKTSEILKLCNESPTLKKINKKYYTIKKVILDNELQKLYSLILKKDSLEDSRALLLLVNSEQCVNLDIIKRKCPIIYKILRCIHVEDNSSVNPIFYEQVQKSIYESLYIHFNGLLDNDILLVSLDSMSRRITSSLCTGKYLDILTLEIMDIENINFLIQLKTFLNIVLSEIEVNISHIS